MRLRLPRLTVAAAALLAACSGADTVAPAPESVAATTTTPLASHDGAWPHVRISEIHYDNTGTDAGEAIEVSAPAGTDLTGWSLVLYNGNGGAAYNTTPLSGVVPATCGERGVVVVTYPVNGIQNGNPDGVALVNAAGEVQEFLSYGGTMTAVGGPANGRLSVDIGVVETSATPIGFSLQRTGPTTWNAPAANTFGACNDDAAPPPPPVVAAVSVTPATATVTVGATQAFAAALTDASGAPVTGVTVTWTSETPSVATVSPAGVAAGVAAGTTRIIATVGTVADTADLTVQAGGGTPVGAIRINELHYDNAGSDQNEGVEVEGAAGTSLAGWSIVLYNGNGGAPYNTTPLTGTLPATCGARGVAFFPIVGIQNGNPDGLALVNPSGAVVEFLSYGGVFTAVGGPANGLVSTDIGVTEFGTTPAGFSLSRNADGSWNPPATASFGACNPGSGTGGGQPTISFAGRATNDPALPVGFEDQLFANVRDANGQAVTTTITWSSETPAIASVNPRGVVRALAAGTAVIRATTAEGVTNTFSLPTRVAAASTTAQYLDHVAFGIPTDGDASDDFLVRRTEYVGSYSRTRNTPNWVAYNLNATHFGGEDRCECFTFDPELPSDFYAYTTDEYTGSGASAGFGIDRGHLARSFDRTGGALDNARSFYFTNIIPQAADQNQGPWAVMENFLGDLARAQNRELYIIAGVAGNRGTLKSEGRVVIPASTWKVAIILPRGRGLADVTSLQDVEVIAAIMPNQPGVRNVDWNTYRTTVDAVEALSGYDLFALLRDDLEIALESNTRPPVAAVNGPFTGSEGTPIAMSGAASTDPDNDALTYAWSFGDGTTGTGATVSHTYAQDGQYTVRLIVTDIRGLADTVTTTATVANVAPVVGTFAGATILPGETYASAGSFTDPGADVWSATVDYGDGSGVQALALAGRNFTLAHVYGRAGTFTVTVRVTDDDATGTGTATVTVWTLQQGTQAAIAAARALDGVLGNGNVTALTATLNAASRSFSLANVTAGTNQVEATLNKLEAFVQGGLLTEQEAAPLRTLLQRIVTSASR